MSEDAVIKIAFEYLSQMSNSIINIGSAAVLVKVLESIISFSTDSKNMQARLGEGIKRSLYNV